MAQSHVIVLGTISSVLEEMVRGGYGEDGKPTPAGEEGGLPYTDYEVRIESVLKGDGALEDGGILVLRMFGHRTQQSDVVTSVAVQLPEPDSYYMFALGQNPDGTYGSGLERLINVDGDHVTFADGLGFYTELTGAEFVEEVRQQAAADGADPSSLEAPALANDEEIEPRSRDARLHPSDEAAALEKELSHAALQDPVGELQAELAAKEWDTFAGLWIEWTPQFRAVVLFTRDGEETIRPYIENRPFADDVEVRTARMTLVELQNAQAAANRAVSDLGIAFGSGTNVKENRVELYVTDPVAVDKALREANTHLPDYVELVKVDEMDTPGSDGGAG